MQKMTHRHTKELDIFFNEHRNACTNCGRPFRDGMCVHLGYIEGNKPAVLCDDCSNRMIETVVRYHWMKREYDPPEKNAMLWRYMDFAKFVHLISSGTLYFAVINSFNDPFEGAKGIASQKEEWDEFYMEFFRQAIKTAPNTSEKELSANEIEKNANRLLSELDSSGAFQRRHTFISCWHESDYESEAMWKLYSADNKNAVAVQTTVEHLYLALGKNPIIEIGKVNYIDYTKRFSSVNGACWYKRKSFEHEKEVRAIINDYRKEEKGLLIPVDLDLLIDKVYLSPYASEWFERVVKSVMDNYGIEKQIVHSSMNITPFY